jgi:hypothetical protein
MGKHNITFGGEYDHFNNNDALYNGAGGAYTFSGGYTAQWVGGLQQANTGIGLADFLLGQYSALAINATPDFGRRGLVLAAHVNDDFRVTQNLTLNLGVRYEAWSPNSSPTNVFQSFSPAIPNPLAGTGSGSSAIAAGQTGITTFENLNGNGEYLWNWDRRFTPRLGFAYRLFGRSDWVLRGGYGIFLAIPQQNGVATSGATGYGISYSASYTPITNPSPVLSAGVPASVVALPPKSALTPTFGDVGTQFAQASISFWAPKMGIPYTQNLNLSIQHQWLDSLIEVGYIGNLGRDMTGGSLNLNLVPPSELAQTATTSVRNLRPYTQFTGSNASVTLVDPNEGVSDYNALAVTFKHNYRHGLMWSVAYTWSKWMDNITMASNSNVNFGDATNIQNPYDITGERSRDTNDIRNRIVISPLYELPFGKGKPFLNRGGILNQFIGGWQASADGLYQSGSPFGPTVSSGGSTDLGDPNYTLRPNKIGPSASPNKWQPATGGVVGIQYLNPASFVVATKYTLGNSPRTLPDINGPGIYDMNIEIAKNWYIKERFKLNFQCNAIDVFNTPYIGETTNGGAWPNETLNAANFGLLNTQANSGIYRRIIEFAMKLYF